MNINLHDTLPSLNEFHRSLVEEARHHEGGEESDESLFFNDLRTRITSIVNSIETALLYEIPPSLTPRDISLIQGITNQYNKEQPMIDPSLPPRQADTFFDPDSEACSEVDRLAELIIKTVKCGQPLSAEDEEFIQQIPAPRKRKNMDTQDDEYWTPKRRKTEELDTEMLELQPGNLSPLYKVSEDKME
jgi:hypothetical protein